jgi:hypothetical protein
LGKIKFLTTDAKGVGFEKPNTVFFKEKEREKYCMRRENLCTFVCHIVVYKWST